MEVRGLKKLWTKVWQGGESPNLKVNLPIRIVTAVVDYQLLP